MTMMITNIARHNSVTLALPNGVPVGGQLTWTTRTDGRTDRRDRGPVDPVARRVSKVRSGTRLSSALRPFCAVKKHALHNSGATVANDTRLALTRGLLVCTVITTSTLAPTSQSIYFVASPVPCMRVSSRPLCPQRVLKSRPLGFGGGYAKAIPSL